MPMGRQDLDILQQPVATELTDDDDFIDEADFSAWYVQQQEDENRRLSTASTGSQRPPRRRSSTILPRNLPISAPFESLDSFTHNGMRLAPGVYVELREGIFHEDFMKIVHIVRDRSTSEITLRGYIFRRTKEMNGVLDKKLNEVCWIIHIDDDDPRDPYLQGVETVPVTEVVKRRRVRLTNQSFPALSWRDDASQDTKEEVETKRVLVCRYQYLCFYPTAKARIANAWCEKGFHRLREDQCDKCSDNNMRDEELRRLWRGVTIPGGARKGWLPGEKEFLRQEGRSQKGLMGNQSLESPFGPNFPIGDPMKRGSVGPILKLRDLEAGFTASNNDWKPNAPFPTGITVDDGDADVEEMDTPPPTAQQRRRVHRKHRKHRTAFAAFTEWPSDSSDYDSEDAKIMFALSRGKRPNSKRLKQKSPRTVEIDAQVKTSSSSGTFQRRYEGKITSIYIPSPLSERKRPAESSSDPPERPAKRRDLDLRADPERRDLSGENGTSRIEGHGRSLIASREISHFDTDHTLGLSQADTPNKSRGYRTNRANLLIPVSLRERGSLHPSVGPGSLSREARYSTIFSTQGSSKQKVENPVIDLTQTQPRLYSASANDRDPCGSLAYQSNSHAWFGPQQTPSPNVYKASPSPRMSFRAASTKGNGYSFLQPTPTPERSPSRLRSPGVRPLPRTSSSKTSLHSPRAGSVTLSHRSSLTSSRTGAQVQVKSENTRPSSAKQRRYTFGDCFCGAGGMSRGAIDAGFRIEWGFDFNLPACQTYAMNFFATPIYNVWANEFAEGGGDHKVDICHLSPPCQFFSDAHTIMGKDDEMNTASLFAIFNLLEKAKPRIVTLEQTSGLIRRHPIFFNAVINMFTSRGFSVRWRVMNCADFGLPQRRMRLFIVASW